MKCNVCILQGVLSSVILFFIPYGAFVGSINISGKDTADLQFFGVAVASILVVAVNIRVNELPI